MTRSAIDSAKAARCLSCPMNVARRVVTAETHRSTIVPSQAVYVVRPELIVLMARIEFDQRATFRTKGAVFPPRRSVLQMTQCVADSVRTALCPICPLAAPPLAVSAMGLSVLQMT